MLLIQADALEAVWCLIFPVVSLSRGSVASDSTYCQVSGFMFALSIESSDFAAFLIAAHTGLYIFRGRDGLYSFRYLSYALCFAFAITFSSLPFLNSPAYVNRSELCYLPYDPDWVRRAFSWIPRYTLFALILLIYTSIYLYVIFAMKKKTYR
jgi:G protein-coupled receptor GPR1